MPNNDNTEKRIGLVQNLTTTGQLDHELQEYLKMVAADERDLRAWTRISELQVQLGQKRDAVRSLKKVAQLHSAQKDADKAIATYEAIGRLAPQDADAHLALATLYRKQGQSQSAVREYELVAQALSAAGKVRESLAIVQTIIDMSPEDVSRRVKLAEQYQQEKMFAEAAREFAAAAAASYVRKTGRRDDDGKRPPVPPSAEPAGTEEEASRLLIEADSFLRLGLIDKAVEHLAAALRRNPTLRRLREPLVKLYVTRQDHKSAIAELWALLTPCTDPQEEIRFLRYILRLDGKDEAAKQRLWRITHRIEPAGGATHVPEPDLLAGASNGDLRMALGSHRPPTDLATTFVFPSADSRRGLEASPSAMTRPNSAEVEAVAEEMALRTGTLREELAEVERWLQAGRSDDARRRLFMLGVRYPHSKKVQAKLKQLEQRSGKSHPDVASGALPASKTTLEVAVEDIQEEQVLAPSVPSPRLGPPPPPPPPPRTTSGAPSADATAASVAFRTGVSLRNRGQYEQAISEFAKARGDAKHGARAALMGGLCHRDQNRIWDSIASFKLGIDSPDASESDLNELFYQLGRSYELCADAREAILFYQMSCGHHGQFRDAAERIARLQRQGR